MNLLHPACMGDEQTKSEQDAAASTKKEAAKAAKKSASGTSEKKRSKKSASGKRAAKKTAEKLGENRFGKRPFPAYSAEEALAVPEAILKNFGGNPTEPGEVAEAMSLSKNSNRFFLLASAARDYGFTEGSRDTKTISVTDRGIAAIQPGHEDERRNALAQAFSSIELLQKVFDHYKGNLPEDKYLFNVLERTFSVPSKYHEEFRKVFEANVRSHARQTSRGATFHTAHIGSDFQQHGDYKYSRTAFVAMPFSEKGAKERPKGFFVQVIQSLITPAVNAAGFNVITADRKGSDVIQATIVKELIEAELVIVDLTDHNPNVLFELGIRIAIGKPILLIRTRDTGAIFDVDNLLRVFIYNENLWPTTLKDDVPKLTESVRNAAASGNTSQYMHILAGESWKKHIPH